LEGVAQGQVSPEAGHTYAEYLTALLVSQPDVAMIDTFFERETLADLFRLASSTLILSAMPALDTATAALKLMLLSSPQLVADHVTCITSQRLVKRICEACKDTIALADSYRQKLGLAADDVCYAGKGCEQCHYTGYAGLVPIFEILPCTEEIRQALLASSSAKKLRHVMAETGVSSLREDGMRRVKQGVTTVQEVLRATMV
jgi:type II secretory ATPase GspE/PulE/Tfp pilus assembly ATPase PilB-like protein